MTRIYLDHASTTPVRPEAVEAMLPHFARGYNPSSPHTEGRAARTALDVARATVAGCLNAKPREIVFTGGGSESDNLAILGVAQARRAEGMHLITAATEHRAVLRAFARLRDDGFTVSVLPVDGDGRVDPATFRRAITPQTTFASIMFANNEVGTLNPVAELAAVAREHGVVFHTDAIQAPGQRALDVVALGVDLLSLSGHKFGGPQGVGILYLRQGTPLVPLVSGGSQELGMRAGTENVPGMVGFARALELATAEMPEAAARLARLRDRLEAGLKAALPGIRINGAGAPRVANNANVSFPHAESQTLVARLDIEGIAVSAGSACAAGASEPSHVIVALGVPSWARGGVVRFSLGRMTTEDEIDSVLNRLPGIVESMRGSAAAVEVGS